MINGQMDPAILDLILFNDAAQYNLVCNDGTAAGFYFKSGNPDKWVLHFQGGGWCFDEPSCAERMKADPQLMSSSVWSDTYPVSGLMDLNPYNNPDWFDATFVYMPYCTSDSFSGSRAPSNETFGWSFYGKYVLTGTIDVLLDLGLKNATYVLISGCSAGGAAVFANADYIADMLPDMDGRIVKRSSRCWLF